MSGTQGPGPLLRDGPGRRQTLLPCGEWVSLPTEARPAHGRGASFSRCQVLAEGGVVFCELDGEAHAHFGEVSFPGTGLGVVWRDSSAWRTLAPSLELVERAIALPFFAESLERTQIQASREMAPAAFSFAVPRGELTEFEQGILAMAASELGGRFWKEFLVREADHRTLFLTALWCVWAHICRFGVLTPLLGDDGITEIMAVEPRRIYVERNGTIAPVRLGFSSEQEMFAIIERIVALAGRRIDESRPWCDARLPDGSRVHAIIPPLALNGPCLTIRKFLRERMGAADLVSRGSASPEILGLLEALVRERRNILVAGGTGTGKTTLLNILSSFLSEDERIITIEDSAELQLRQPHVVRLEARPSNTEGRGEVPLRELVRNALRMRPDRIVVGECRGGEALDMLQAMNTGHEGSMTTVHANSPLDALKRLETLVLFAASGLPLVAVREQIASSVHAVVQLARVKGHRYIARVEGVEGLCERTGSYRTRTLSEFVPCQEGS